MPGLLHAVDNVFSCLGCRLYYGSNSHTMLIWVPKFASQNPWVCFKNSAGDISGMDSVSEKTRINRGLEGVSQIPNIGPQNLAESDTDSAMNRTVLLGPCPQHLLPHWTQQASRLLYSCLQRCLPWEKGLASSWSQFKPRGGFKNTFKSWSTSCPVNLWAHSCWEPSDISIPVCQSVFL